MARASIVQRLSGAALDLVFPPRCGVCGSGGALLCEACRSEMTPAGGARCHRCWRPGLGFPCHSCRIVPPAFDLLRSSFVYTGPARAAVLALKYRGMSALAAPMAELMAPTARELSLHPDVIVPVPLTGSRLRSRGYNQSDALARALAREIDLLARRALRRTRSSPPQARAADIEERRRNVADAFEAAFTGVSGARVLLIDDVTTTGSTLDACARALAQANARSISCPTFARED